MSKPTPKVKKSKTKKNSPKSHVVLREWLQVILAGLLSAGLLTLCFPNFNGFYLAFIALVPIFIIIERKKFIQALVGLVIFVIVFYTGFMYWVNVFHPIALPGVVFYMVLIYTLPFITYRLLRGRHHSVYDPILLAAIFTIFEYGRSLGFARFPYGVIAYTQYPFLAFIQISDITGYLGVSFLLYLSNSFIAHMASNLRYIEKSARESFKTVFGGIRFLLFNRMIVLVILLGGSISYGYLVLQNEDKYARVVETEKISGIEYPLEPFSVTMIQPWFDYNITENRKEILKEKVFRLTRESLAGKQTVAEAKKTRAQGEVVPAEEKIPDLLIWPESTIDVYYEYELQNILAEQKRARQRSRTQNNPTPRSKSAVYTEELYTFLKEIGKEYGTTLLSGAFALELKTKQVLDDSATANPNNSNPSLKTIVTGTESYNASLLINPRGRIIDWIGKIYLVPFAEYFPYTAILKTFPFVERMLDNANATQFTSYDQYKLFVQNDIPFATLICYEDTFADLSRTYTLAGARFLVVITNDAWSYSVRSQNIHYAFSFFRAIENRRPLVRVGNAGVTTLIDPLGRTHGTLDMFVEGITSATFSPRSSLSIYSTFGDWFVYLLAILIFFFIMPFSLVRGCIRIVSHIIRFLRSLPARIGLREKT